MRHNFTNDLCLEVTQHQINTSANLYKESKKAIAEREREEKRRRLEEQTDFSAEDLSLATVPGMEFDPSQRTFDLEELRPQPIIKKRSKLFVKDREKVIILHDINIILFLSLSLFSRMINTGRNERKITVQLGDLVRLGG